VRLSVARARSARSVALAALLAGGNVKAALEREFRDAGLAARDRALATELANGTLKMQRALGWSLARFLRRPLATLDTPVRWALLLGAYQLLYADKIPRHAAVNETVALARATGHAGTAALANAVMRKLAADPQRPPLPAEGDVTGLASYASLPDWIAAHLIQRFRERARQAAEGMNLPARVAVRVNTARWKVAAARSALERAGANVGAGAYGIPECLIVRNVAAAGVDWLRRRIATGELAFQSEESQLAVQLLDPTPGETILDVCAGRGTKTALIALRLSGAGRIISIDDDEKKLGALRAAIERAGLGGVATVACDARAVFPPAVPRLADAALVDAPCSALGILGRRADARWQKSPADCRRLARVQAAIIRRAAECIRPGGRLLYVTCSTSAAEDEDVVQTFLGEDARWRALPLVAPAGADAGAIGPFLLVTPGIDGNDGFFYALLERRHMERPSPASRELNG